MSVGGTRSASSIIDNCLVAGGGCLCFSRRRNCGKIVLSPGGAKADCVKSRGNDFYRQLCVAENSGSLSQRGDFREEQQHILTGLFDRYLLRKGKMVRDK